MIIKCNNFALSIFKIKTLELRKPFSRPRLPHELLFAFGGWSGGSPTPVVEVYDCRADRWTLLDCSDRG